MSDEERLASRRWNARVDAAVVLVWLIAMAWINR
jgi:hypothetical protein